MMKPVRLARRKKESVPNQTRRFSSADVDTKMRETMALLQGGAGKKAPETT